ncbi:MAG: Holliday junction resolvase RuvX [Bacteroidetes bacterium]|nr:Holliday junction resolvase RuvX [Bacteroidota bacterium]
MSKILAIDYGTKRTGFAISDDSRTFAFGLSTQETKNNLSYLKSKITSEKIDTIVIGIPKKLNNEFAQIVPEIERFITQIQQAYPSINIVRADERFTSKMAFQSMIDNGVKKKNRQNKALVDEIAATLILQNYLETL